MTEKKKDRNSSFKCPFEECDYACQNRPKLLAHWKKSSKCILSEEEKIVALRKCKKCGENLDSLNHECNPLIKKLEEENMYYYQEIQDLKKEMAELSLKYEKAIERLSQI